MHAKDVRGRVSNRRDVWVADTIEGQNLRTGSKTVVRFKDQKSFDTAREKITSDREKIIKSLEEKGVKMQENMRLEEVAGA